ncbi:forkhead family transcription factor FKH2 KNAG_0M01920 [Huiozyma naganishii CBS 8797]|uniref:Fork-head domain-containing protein n=1 Tax=Huiozyma naganishii (strain ATCC MYA-139 / BCRC 22969 / CBS 8797 / KCTC 17520 / NBRC 10181 / NCYC 3082 / Yp74L-3) TaxID=1071383 RepID=J7RDY3_HUIN7|nr:hypothetical protein KNAG_0M01920 [Kazachstania naganishii CBS 8797]CCK73045.1 hypothetical protein KNAG_0M01920 [Kazachstania naganishii CBS 8797]
MSGSYYNHSYSQEQHQGLINLVISTLDTPEEPTIVSKHYSNERNIASEIQAYAKISGRDWTYYVKNLEVSIGRDTESNFDVLPPLNDAHGGAETADGVGIDLGPAKVVSRKHAFVKYNIQAGCWELHVAGRNGAKVNFQRVHSGPNAPPVPLTSGTILDIGGTQMIFILPDQTPVLSDLAIENVIPKLVSVCGADGNTNNRLINDLIKNSKYANQDIDQRLRQQNQDGSYNQQDQVRIFKMYSSTSPNQSQFQNFNGNGQFVPQTELSGPTTIVNREFLSSNNSQQMKNSTAVNLQRLNALTVNGFPHAMDFATDLSLDENRTVKPPHSYATMITQAILSSAEGIISLADIYRFISTNYAYYRFAKTGWQNSIRHNLSLNKAFEKVPRRPNEPGKGMKWRISETFQTEFLDAWYTGKLAKIKRGSSVFRQLQMHMSKYNQLPGQKESGDRERGHSTTSSMSSANSRKTDPISSATSSNMNPLQHPLPPLAPPYHQQNQLPHIDAQNGVQEAVNGGNAPTYGPNPSETPKMNDKNNTTNASGRMLPFVTKNTNETANGMERGTRAVETINTILPSITTSIAGLGPSHSASSSGASLLTMPTSNNGSRVSLSGGTSASGGHTATSTNSANTIHANGGPSAGYDSLIRSPTKAFQVTAMEAYTPERGSAVNHQNKSPKELNDAIYGDSKKLGGTGTKLTPSSSKSQNTVRSSPGVWNLLQFSSVNSTPAVISGAGTKSDDESDKRQDANGETHDMDEKDIASPPPEESKA